MSLSMYERRNIIKDDIENKGSVDIEQLSNQFSVSQMTIRRDLKVLENEGIIKRTMKGAIPVNDNSIDDTLRLRLSQNKAEKIAIARYAANLINNDDVIIIDASTTALELCKFIMDKSITVITNSLSVAVALSSSSHVNVIVLGGTLRRGSLSLIGHEVVENFERYNINKAFISSKALSYDEGLTDINMFEVETKKAAIKKSSQVIVLLDHTKINKTSLLKVCDIQQITRVITCDSDDFTQEDRALLKECQKNGIIVNAIK